MLASLARPWWAQIGVDLNAGGFIANVRLMQACLNGITRCEELPSMQDQADGDPYHWFAASFYIRPDATVQFVARTILDTHIAYSPIFAWPELTQVAEHAKLLATFRNARGNQYWVEVDVSATNDQVVAVDMRINDTDWQALTRQSYGSWAKGVSLGIPFNTPVTFRARGRDGFEATRTYNWPP